LVLIGELANTSGLRMVKLLEPTMMVWPSGGDLTTSMVPSAPDAPGRFS